MFDPFARDTARWNIAADRVEEEDGLEREYPCGPHGHLDCATTFHGRCSAEEVAKAMAFVTEADIDKYLGLGRG